ncbi:MAG: hypothetical protein V4501_07760 [Pseudomonadota bacterium]
MNFSKWLFCSTSLAASMLMSGAIHAENCYDPSNNTYFACNVDEEEYYSEPYPVEGEIVYGAAVGAAVAAGAYYSHNNGNYNGYYHNNYNGNYHNYNGNYHGNGSYHGGNRGGGWHR